MTPVAASVKAMAPTAKATSATFFFKFDGLAWNTLGVANWFMDLPLDYRQLSAGWQVPICRLRSSRVAEQHTSP
jgi:hypothetical protein